MLSHKNENFFLQSIKSNFFYSTFSKIKHFLNNNSKSQSKKNIKYHYDLGNTFYEQWLDKTMTYSSAIFDNKNTIYLMHRFNKYKKIADSLSLNENSQNFRNWMWMGWIFNFCSKKI